MRILLVDDDEQLMEVLANRLIEEHYAVDIATDGEMGWEFILLFNYDLVVLDWMLPHTNGIDLCRQIRNSGYEMPIMLLTARDRHTDKVRGLDAGADDYVVKPFNFEELTARIRALLRREIHVSSPILHYEDLSLDPKTHEVKYQQQILPLTPKEYGLIELFMRHPQQVFSPGAIIDNLWAGEDPPGEEAVRTHIKGLRQKLKRSGMAKDTIQTVYGVGYRLKSLTSDSSQSDRSPKTPKSESVSSQKIKQAWLQFKDVAEARLAVLNDFNTALTENRITETLLTKAKSSAHKLAGSLGGFGFPEASNIAKQIENLLETNLASLNNRRQLTELIASLNKAIQARPAENVSAALGKNISLLIIDRDSAANSSTNLSFGRQLATEAEQWNINSQITSNLERARAIIEQELIAIVIHRIIFPDGEDLVFLDWLHQQQPLLPIAVIIKDAELLERLEIVRRGGNLVLQQPIAPNEAIAAVVELLKSLGSSAKVMIVDDDPQLLLSLEIALQPWGFEIATLDNPQQFWHVLEKFKPDLLVLDIEMPEINGIELCQVLRCDRRWQQLPVLFLTAHQDEKTQHQAFAIGADDYICKPVAGSELANRILNRLQRSRLLKS